MAGLDRDEANTKVTMENRRGHGVCMEGVKILVLKSS